MKYLYASGCSFTKGDGVKRNIEEAPFLVANKFGLYSYNAVPIDSVGVETQEYYNTAMAGGCNSYIRRKTIDWLSENQDKWEDVIVLVGWTSPFRHEMFISEFCRKNTNHHPSQFEDDCYLQMTSNISLYPYYQGFLTEGFYKRYMVNHWDGKEQVKCSLDGILYLQSFLKLNNIKYVFWNSLNNQHRSRYNEHTGSFLNVKGMYSLIDLNHWISNDIEYSWEEFLDEVDEDRSKTRLGGGNNHPNPLGHKLWADEIYKKIEELYDI